MNEFSAGGVIIKDKKLLIVKVKNLSGKIVWTFPKGHIEKSEKIKNAALREVSEETGYSCKIIKSLGKTQYGFRHQNKFISKKVAWFLMSPLGKIGTHDHEILTTRWVKITEGKKYLKYETDLKLLEKIL
ncbi:MAG: NUDIX domain-containing protein [Elusimicrobia bacterium]|nr:NUDIX domain-containing protein [Elusimicrobiota bacterium]